MAKQINLIPKITEEELKVIETRRNSSLIAVVIVLLSGVLVLGVYGYQSFLQLRLTAEKKKVDSLSAQLDSVRVKESVIKGVDVKLTRYEDIIKKYPTFPRVSDTLLRYGSGLVIFTDMKVEEDKSLSFAILAEGKDNMSAFLTKLMDPTALVKFKDITVEEFVSDDTNVYRATMHLKWDQVT